MANESYTIEETDLSAFVPKVRCPFCVAVSFWSRAVLSVSASTAVHAVLARGRRLYGAWSMMTEADKRWF